MAITSLQRRTLEIAYKHRLSHIGSCISAVGILDSIFAAKASDEPLILSAGHCGLALYVCLEKWEHRDAEDLMERHGTHPSRDAADGIWYTTGSLGCGITAACGFALADRNRRVHCLVSDGECGEPDVFGALAFAHDNRLDNLRVHVNANGYSAYGSVDITYLSARLRATWDRVIIHHTSAVTLPGLAGLSAHYTTLSEEGYYAAISA